MDRITFAVTHDDYVLEVHLNNNHIILCDMKTRLNGIRFRHLRDEKQFAYFEIFNGNTIKWTENCQLSLDEILLMLEK